MKKGFTLMELLGIIVVLGIITLITYGVISNNVESSRKKAYEISVQNVIEATKQYVIKNDIENDFPEGGIDIANKEIDLKHDDFISGLIKRNEKGIVEVVNLTNGKYCANGTKQNLKIEKGTCEASDETEAEVKIKELTKTEESITFLVKMQDAQSGIIEYEYCVEEKCEKKQMNGERDQQRKIIKIDKLKKATEYEIEVRVKNGKGLVTTSKIKSKTEEIEKPVFAVSTKTYALTKIVRITYPEVNKEIYKFSYKINGEEKEVIENKVEIEIKEESTIEAIIKREETEVIKEELIVTGIDNETPKVNVEIPDYEKWTKSKKINVVAKDEGTGLALRSYSYDGGIKWEKESTKTYKTVEKLKLRVRDRLGNTNNKFTINGTIECVEECTIMNIDELSPEIVLELKEGTKGKNDWYVSERVKIGITLKDYYSVGGVKTEGGSGIDESSLKVNVNGKIENATRVGVGKYEIVLKENKIYSIKVNASDNVGNKAKEKTMTIKKDSGKPKVEIMNPTNGNWTSKDFSLTLTSSTISGIEKYEYSYDKNNWITYSESGKGTYQTTKFSKERNQEVYIRSTSNSGIVSDISSTWIRIDKKVPKINPKQNPIQLKEKENYNYINNLTVEYGISGKKSLTCNPGNNNESNSTTVKCTIVANNNLSATTSFTVKRSYNAVCGKHLSVCKNPTNCYWFDDSSGNANQICDYSCDDGTTRNNVKAYQCREYGWCGVGDEWTYETNDWCTCPNGGILDTNSKMCVFK